MVQYRHEFSQNENSKWSKMSSLYLDFNRMTSSGNNGPEKEKNIHCIVELLNEMHVGTGKEWNSWKLSYLKQLTKIYPVIKFII